jgi:putative peptidoglycan lipid II flippase
VPGEPLPVAALDDPDVLAHPYSESATAHVALSAGKIGLGTFISRILGLVRDMVRAYFFGTGMAADAFTVAFRLPNLLRSLLGEGALSAAFVPIFGEYLAKRGRREAWALAGAAWSLLALVLIAVAIVGVLVTPYLVKVMAFGYRSVPGKLDLTISLTRIMFPYIVFVGLAALAMGMLNSLRHFFAPAISPVLLNLGMIASMVIFGPRMGNLPEKQVYALAGGVLVGGAAQLAIQIPFLKKMGMSFRFRPNWHHPGVKRIVWLMAPGVIGLGVLEVNSFVDTFLGAMLRPGSVAALEYGNRLMQLPLGIFGVAVGTAILPTLAIQAAREDYNQLRDTFSFAVRYVCFIMIPATVGLMVLRYPIIRLLLERGQFRHGQSVSMTASALMFYAAGLVCYGSVKCVAPVFYSLKDTRTPVKTGVTAMLSNVVLNVILMQFLGLGGLALATALSSLLNLTLLLRQLRRRLGYIKGSEMLTGVARMGLAGVVMAAACWVSMTLVERSGLSAGLPGRLAEVLFCGALGLVAYIVSCKALRCSELGFAAGLIRKRFGRGGEAK